MKVAAWPSKDKRKFKLEWRIDDVILELSTTDSYIESGADHRADVDSDSCIRPGNGLGFWTGS
jgi:hypothetical protein